MGFGLKVFKVYEKIRTYKTTRKNWKIQKVYHWSFDNVSSPVKKKHWFKKSKLPTEGFFEIWYNFENTQYVTLCFSVNKVKTDIHIEHEDNDFAHIQFMLNGGMYEFEEDLFKSLRGPSSPYFHKYMEDRVDDKLMMQWIKNYIKLNHGDQNISCDDITIITKTNSNSMDVF